jgi:hypothetical protein
MNSAIVALLTHGVEAREALRERGLIVKIRARAPGEVEREITELQRETKESQERLQSAIAELVLRIEKVEGK